LRGEAGAAREDKDELGTTEIVGKAEKKEGDIETEGEEDEEEEDEEAEELPLVLVLVVVMTERSTCAFLAGGGNSGPPDICSLDRFRTRSDKGFMDVMFALERR
jgi:hypothetical protein